MSHNRFVALCAVTLILVNCTKDETATEKSTEHPESKDEPKEIVYLTYSSQEFEDTLETDDWVIVHDQDGELLDYRTFEKNNTLVFKAMDTSLAKTKNIVVTTLTVRQTENTDFHTIYTYTDIPKGFVWNTEKDENGSYQRDISNLSKTYKSRKTDNRLATKAGSYNITVNDIPGLVKYNITSAATGVVSADYGNLEGNTLSLENVQLETGVKYIFFVGDAEGGLKHTFFEVDEDSQNIVFDYGDFENFETVMETVLPDNKYLFSVSRGYESADNPGRGYEMTVELNFENPSISKIGYIPGYESYSTAFQITLNNGYAYRYQELGVEPLKTIKILEKPVFSVSDTTLNNFSFNTDIDYIRTGSNWNYEENFPDATYISSSWSVDTSDKTLHMVGNLPIELLETYPKLNLDKLKHYSTTLVIRGKTYESVLNDLTYPAVSSFPKISESIVLYSE